MRGASNYVKTNTFEQGLILTTLTHELHFLNFHAPLWDARQVLKGTRTRSILKPLTHFRPAEKVPSGTFLDTFSEVAFERVFEAAFLANLVILGGPLGDDFSRKKGV